MDDLEQQIQTILADPEQMKRVMELAQSIGLPIPSEEQPEAMEAPAVPTAITASSALGEKKQHVNGQKTQSEELLYALKPFLKPDRQRKLEQALQMARLSRIAGSVFQKKQTEER